MTSLDRIACRLHGYDHESPIALLNRMATDIPEVRRYRLAETEEVPPYRVDELDSA